MLCSCERSFAKFAFVCATDRFRWHDWHLILTHNQRTISKNRLHSFHWLILTTVSIFFYTQNLFLNQKKIIEKQLMGMGRYTAQWLKVEYYIAGVGDEKKLCILNDWMNEWIVLDFIHSNKWTGTGWGYLQTNVAAEEEEKEWIESRTLRLWFRSYFCECKIHSHFQHRMWLQSKAYERLTNAVLQLFHWYRNFFLLFFTIIFLLTNIRLCEYHTNAERMLRMKCLLCISVNVACVRAE